MIQVETAAALRAELEKNPDAEIEIIEGDISIEISTGSPILRLLGAAILRLVARGSSQPHVVARESSQPHVVAWESSQPHVVAWESSQPHVVAWESSQPHVVAWGSSQPHVEAWGSSQPHVEAWESSQPHVVAWESSQPHVVAWGSSQPHVEAWESSQPHVVAWESSQPHVVAWGSSQPHVVARGSSQPHVVAWESSQPHVVARGSSQPHVVAWGSSQPHVVAWESSQPHVEARESSQPHVVARGSSQPHVVAWGSSQPHVVAWGYVQLALTGARIVAKAAAGVSVLRKRGATCEGGKQTEMRLNTAAEWCEFYGVEVQDGVAVLFKAVNNDFTSPRGALYAPGEMTFADDWDGGAQECGRGLHFSPSPSHALEFHTSAKRFVGCPVRVDDIAVHPDGDYPQKVKARGVCAPCFEVDRKGVRVTPVVAEAVNA